MEFKWLVVAMTASAAAYMFVSGSIFLQSVGIKRSFAALWPALQLLVAVSLGGFTLIVAVSIGETVDLMDRLSWNETRVLVVTELREDESEVCGVLDNDNDVVCLPREAILNADRPHEEFTAPAVVPGPGNIFTIKRAKIDGEDGVLFKIDP